MKSHTTHHQTLSCLLMKHWRDPLRLEERHYPCCFSISRKIFKRNNCYTFLKREETIIRCLLWCHWLPRKSTVYIKAQFISRKLWNFQRELTDDFNKCKGIQCSMRRCNVIKILILSKLFYKYNIFTTKIPVVFITFGSLTKWSRNSSEEWSWESPRQLMG